MSGSQKVLITDFAWPDLSVEKGIFAQAGIEVVEPSDDSDSGLVEAASQVSAIMTNWKVVGRDLIDASTSLKIVSRMGIGLDNIDIDHCTQKGVMVTNVPDYCVDEVAQHALALILALGRQIAFQHHQCKTGIYRLDSGNEIRRLSTRTVGLVGTGNTAQKLAEYCVGLGFKVLTFSRSGKEIPGCQAVSEDQLLSESDFLSLHIPATDETERWVNADRLAKMKKGAYLINIARGAIVDQKALLDAIKQGHIAGAGLDVQDPEPPNLEDELFSHPQVIVTPHAAFWSEESLLNLRQRSAKQVVDCLQGRKPENVVNDIC